MELAVLLSAGLREWIDFGVIIGILMLNAVVGWYQEKQAADVVASLKGDIAMRSTVVRNGAEEEIKARDLVPGDIVSLSTCSLVISILTISFFRLLSKMVKSSLPILALSARTTTQTVTKLTAENSRHNLENLPTRRRTMIERKERDTDLVTRSLPSINLP